MRARRFTTRLGIAAATVAIALGAFCLGVGAVAGNALPGVSLLLLQTGCVVGFPVVSAAAWLLLLSPRLSPSLERRLDQSLPCWRARSARAEGRQETDLADNVAVFSVALGACCLAAGPAMAAVFSQRLTPLPRQAFLAFSATVIVGMAWVQAHRVHALQLYSGGSKTRPVSGLRLSRFLSCSCAVAGGAVLLAFHLAGGPVAELVELTAQLWSLRGR